ncbi:hypothetical protein E1A91_D01G013600v1 [Gossypium mustelinum]|uniref:Uncharacterized protein n=1 Tax=Gossypium mustelinum TaxID=34275 RepID=A0A5D2W2E3_GOSMU|nr:hypothetical protein E1A91_D01G013600v1 [Gossypium mustelinum]
MGKISLTHVFILALLFTANVEAQKRCSKVLNPSRCLLAECRQECSEKCASGVVE